MTKTIIDNGKLYATVEYGHLYSDGSFKILSNNEIYPLSRQIAHIYNHGGRVFKRTITTIEDWKEIGQDEYE